MFFCTSVQLKKIPGESYVSYIRGINATQHVLQTFIRTFHRRNVMQRYGITYLHITDVPVVRPYGRADARGNFNPSVARRQLPYSTSSTEEQMITYWQINRAC